MAVTLQQFIDQLTASGVLSPNEIRAFHDALPATNRPTEAQAFARELVRAGKLTKYQASALYQGKTKGLVLGNYVILDKLGAGGMGQVFKARHRRMKRIVALKVLPAEATKSPENVKRFHREVEAAARLEHPNIVTSYDADEAEGTHFLVMQCVEGKDLSAIVKENGPLAVAQAVECTKQAALGLAYAHKRGVIHRDIKPANLLLDSEGTVKILDMGLARLEGQLHDVASVAGLTQSGQVMGTVDYMSPEQAEETRGVDARADQYSLGCTLWVLLTGRPMFGGTTTIAKLMAHRTQPAPSLCAARADVSTALEALYQRMVAKEPGDRFASMDEVIAALATCLGDAPPSSLDGPSSTDSRLTEFFQQIAGTKTAAPPKSVTAVDEETEQLQPAKQETGTEHKIAAPARTEVTQALAPHAKAPSTKTVAPLAVAATSAIVAAKSAETTVGKAHPTKKKRRLHPLALATGIAIAGLGTMGSLLAAVLWFVLPDGDSTTNTPPTIAAVDESIAPPLMPVGAPPLAIAPFDATTAKQHQQAWADFLGVPVEKEIALPGGAKLTMALIPPGEFLMGSSNEERAKLLAEARGGSEQWTIDWIPTEGPQHRVRITQPFYIGKNEVTQAQWESLIGSNPSEFKDEASQPVESVSWEDIQPFLTKLNESALAAGMKFGLPTEAQWEYACRAGTTTTWHSGESEELARQYGWFQAHAEGKTHPVGRLPGNGFGLHDMYGNVWERCADWHAADYYAKSPVSDPHGPATGTHHVDRGGSCFDSARVCRSANHFHAAPSNRGNNHGFRLAATIDVAKVKAAAAKLKAAALANFALEFDGKDDHVDLPTLVRANDSPLTIEGWVRRMTRREDQIIFRLTGTNSCHLYWRDNERFVGVEDSLGVLRRIEEKQRREPPFEWMHAAFVIDDREYRLYIDGCLANTMLKDSVGPWPTASPFSSRIGAEAGENPRLPFLGLLDEIRVSKSARYKADFTPRLHFVSDEDTLAIYHFDEGEGDVLRDSSGNDHHGKIVGAKWVRQTAPTTEAAVNVPGDLLPGIDLETDAPLGAWRREKDGIHGEPTDTKIGGLILPVIPAKDYEVTIEFTLPAGEPQPAKRRGIGMQLIVGQRTVGVSFRADETSQVCPRWFDAAGTNWSTGAKVYYKFGERHTLKATVESEQIRFFFDGLEITSFKAQDITHEDGAIAGVDGRLGITSVGGPLVLHRVNVDEVQDEH